MIDHTVSAGWSSLPCDTNILSLPSPRKIVFPCCERKDQLNIFYFILLIYSLDTFPWPTLPVKRRDSSYLSCQEQCPSSRSTFFSPQSLLKTWIKTTLLGRANHKRRDLIKGETQSLFSAWGYFYRHGTSRKLATQFTLAYWPHWLSQWNMLYY